MRMEDAQRRREREMAAAAVLRSVGKFGRSTSLGVLVLLGAALPATTQQAGAAHVAPSLPVQMDLHRAEPVRFSALGPKAILTNIKCGPGGDIYAVYTTSSLATEREQPVRRISASSRRVTEYPVAPISGYEKLLRLSFDVSADGTLYALVRGTPQSAPGSKPDPVYLIVKYKDDGSMDSHFAVGEVPGKHINPISLAVFADGHSLVSGTTLEKAADKTSLGVFSAMFDQNGAFRAPITFMKPATPAESSASPSPRGAPPAAARQPAAEKEAEKEKDSADPITLASSLLSVSSSDGNIYVLQNVGRLDVVSLSGSVEREFKLKPPANGLSPLQMAAAGPGFLFVSYDHLATGEPGENGKYRSMVTVVDPRSGEVTAIYSMPEAETDFAVSACAASPNDFVFLNSDDQGYLEVVHYAPN